MVRFRAIQLCKGEADKTAGIGVFHVTGGMDACCVGFHRRHMLCYKDEYDGRLAQIIKVFNEKSKSPSDRAKHYWNKGCCRAVLIEAEYRESPVKKKPKTTDESQTIP